MSPGGGAAGSDPDLADQVAPKGERPPAAVGPIVAKAAAALAGVPGSSPRLEAELLLLEATGLSRTALVAWPQRPLGAGELARFESLLARRLAGEPIAYIRGRQAFWTLELLVGPETLIPRPETELLVEVALELADGRQRLAADLGTGSGAIAAALASERPAWTVLAVDRSAAALRLARTNFARLGLANCLVCRGDWLGAIRSGALDLILANPPYVRDGDPHLGEGDLRFEPRPALAAGADGLDAIRAIALEARRCLAPGAPLALEHGFDQGESVRRLLGSLGLRRAQTRRDLAGLERVSLAWA